MATAPILQIPVDDSQFEAFKESFQGYHDALKRMPADWQAVNVRILSLAKVQRELGVSADKAWANATKAATDYSRTVKQASEAQGMLAKHTSATAAAADKLGQAARSLATRGLGEGTVRRMTAIGKASKMVAHDFAAVGKVVGRLARFSLFGVGGGLLGLGGLTFGLDRLADTVVNRQKSARGLGLTPGQLASFNVHFAPFAGTNALQGAAEAQVDASKAGWLATLGINPQLAANEPATRLSEQEMLALHRQLRGVPNNILMNTAAAIAAEHLGFSQEDIRRIHGTRAATLMLASAETNRDSGALGFTRQTAKEWRDFQVQLHKAGVLIETALINTLVPLTPGLTMLSREIAKFITDLGKSGEVKAAVANLEIGVKDFAKWIGSPNFRSDLHTFADGISQAAHGIVAALRWLGLIPESEDEKLKRLSREQGIESPVMARARNSVIPGEGEEIRQAINSRVQRSSASDVMADIRKSSAKYGVDPAFVTRIAKVESGLGQAKMLVSSSGAIGVMQLEPGTARDLKVNPYNTASNIEGGVHYIAELLHHYNGNEKEAAAAYNAGTGPVDAAIRAGRGNWEDRLNLNPSAKREVQHYVTETARPVFPGGAFSTTESPRQASPAHAPLLARGTLPLPSRQPSRDDAIINGVLDRLRRQQQPSSSDIAQVRERHLRTSATPTIHIVNNTSSNAFVSANAAAP